MQCFYIDPFEAPTSIHWKSTLFGIGGVKHLVDVECLSLILKAPPPKACVCMHVCVHVRHPPVFLGT